VRACVRVRVCVGADFCVLPCQCALFAVGKSLGDVDSLHGTSRADAAQGGQRGTTGDVYASEEGQKTFSKAKIFLRSIEDDLEEDDSFGCFEVMGERVFGVWGGCVECALGVRLLKIHLGTPCYYIQN